MKKRFFNWFISAILIAIFSFSALARSGSNGLPQKKEKLQVLLVEKKGGNRPSGNGESKPRQEDRKKSQ